MAKRKITAGIASVCLPISVADTSSTTGGGLSGLVFNTAGLVAEYRRQGQSAWTAITLAAGTLGTWSSGGFIADGALAGDYELGVPNACFVAGARWVAIRLRGAANMLAVRIEIEIDAVDYQDGVRAGLTALPNAAANAAGGLPVSIAGALDLDEMNADIEAIQTNVDVASSSLATAANMAEANADLDELITSVAAVAASIVSFPLATVSASPAPSGTSIAVTGLALTTANAYKDAYALFLSGVNAFSAAHPVASSSYSAGTTTLTFAGLLAAPASSDTLIILGSIKRT